NIPRMMGVSGQPSVINEKIIPLEAHGVKIISLGMMIEPDQPAIWRGPIVMKIINQFLGDVAWGQLDYLFVDMPPGSGERLAKAVELPLLGQVPLYPRVMEGGDNGAPIVTADAQSSAARALEK